MLTSMVTANCRSLLSPRWPARARELAQAVRRHSPSFLAAQECYAAQRPFLARALASQMKLAAAHKGKVLFYNPKRWVLETPTIRRYSLGHGKHAVAALFHHRTRRRPVVAVSAHLLNGKRNRAKRRVELQQLLRLIERDFGADVPVLIGADFNDPTPELSGVYKPFGYGDVKYDVPASKRKNARFSTYHGFQLRAPLRGKHIDAVLGRDAVGRSWRLLVDRRKRGRWGRYSDHFAVFVQVRLDD